MDTCIANMPIPVAVWYMASLVGIAGSNPAGGLEVCLLWVLFVVRKSSLSRSDHSSRGVVPSVVCVSVILCCIVVTYLIRFVFFFCKRLIAFLYITA